MNELQSIILHTSLFVSLFFEVFLLITYLEVRSDIKRENELLALGPKHFPSVTIVVPCFNEERTVEATIESLLKLDYPQDKFSLVLVNDGSTDGTFRTLSQFTNNSQIRVLNKENGGKHTAVNLALTNINSDLVGCLDADSFVTPDALRRIVPYFDDTTVMAVTPSIKVHEPRNFLQYIQRTEYSWSIFLRRMLSSMGALYVTPGPFSIFRTQVFRDLGDYKYAHMTEDMEMALRMQKHHYKIINSQSAHVYTVTPSKLSGLVKQRSRWTYGFLNNVLDYKELFFNKKYGHIGMFILPIAIFSIFSTLFLVSSIVWETSSRILDSITRFRAVGFNWDLSFPTFDWYFINTGVLPIITIIAILLTMTILYLSLKLADGGFKMSKGLFYYLFFYTFLAPLWLTKALFDIIFKRKVSWR